MNWKNLQTFACPHCGQPLLKREEENEIICSVCKFTINSQRFDQILKHRSKNDQVILRIKWQNLHMDRCPLCSEMLNQDSDNKYLKRCANDACNFTIKDWKLREIMDDQDHPVNRFKFKIIGNL